MRAVILAAGEGTRMRPLTENKPKVMLPIANKPMLEYTLLAARDAGITDILLIVGYRKESIIDYFGDGSKLGLNIEYVTQERQRGTGDAFGMAAGHFDDRFVAMNGDITVSAATPEKAGLPQGRCGDQRQAGRQPRCLRRHRDERRTGDAHRGKVPAAAHQPGQRRACTCSTRRSSRPSRRPRSRPGARSR